MLWSPPLLPVSPRSQNKGSWTIARRKGPIVAAAIHAGQTIPPVVAQLQKIGDVTRSRFEECHIERLCAVTGNQISVHLSRFVVDFDRTREQAVYLNPSDAWGLDVWREPPPRELYCQILALYDLFYDQVRCLLEQMVTAHGAVVVLDLHTQHSANRSAEATSFATLLNLSATEISTQKQEHWARLLERFRRELNHPACENAGTVDDSVGSHGGAFASWVNRTFGDAVCAITVRVPNTFTHPLTGAVVPKHLNQIKRRLRSASLGLLEEIEPANRALSMQKGHSG